MAGQRNSKWLKVILAVAGTLVGLYVLMGYRHASSEAASRAYHLKLAEEEFNSLRKRFDMLSNELKGALQSSADLKQQLKEAKETLEETKKEREELNRQCHVEGVRLESEKARLIKDKQQLIEDMDQVKRERDRLSSQHDSLTQECNDARENAANREHQLQSDCDDRVTQCQTQASRTQTDLATCTRNLEATNAEKITCNNDLRQALDASNHYASQLQSMHQVGQQQQQQQQQQQLPNQRRSYEQQPQQPQQQVHQNKPSWQDTGAQDNAANQVPSWRQPGGGGVGERDPGVGVGGGQPPLGQQHSWADEQDSQGHFQKRDAESHHAGLLQRPDQHGAYGDRPVESKFRKDPSLDQHQPLHADNPVGVADRAEKRQPEGEEPSHVSEEKRRAAYDALRAKLARGEVLEEKQQQLYRLLSRRYRNEEKDAAVPPSHPQQEARSQLSQHHPEPVIQQPPPGNEQEEVKDLVEGGGGAQQKAEAFDNNAKEHRQHAGGGARRPDEVPYNWADNAEEAVGHPVPVQDRPPHAGGDNWGVEHPCDDPRLQAGAVEGGAGGPVDDDADEGVELENEGADDDDDDDDGVNKRVGHDKPLPDPVKGDHPRPLDELEQGEKEVLNDDNEEDVVDYEQPAGDRLQHGHLRREDEDQHAMHMFEEEQQRLLRREAESREIGEERDVRHRQQREMR